MTQSYCKMEPQRTSLVFCILAAVIFSANGLDFHWCDTPSANKQLQCSVDAKSFTQDIFTIIDLTIFDVTNNRTAQKVATITVMDTDPQIDNVSESFLAVEGSISQHNADLVVTFSNQTFCLLCYYMCELNFINPDGHPVVVRSSTIKSPKTGSDDSHNNVTVGLANQMKAIVDRLTSITHDVEDRLTDKFALFEKKLENITLLEEKLDNIALLQKKLDSIAQLEGKLDKIAQLEGKLDNLAVLEGKRDNLAVLEGKLDNIAILEGKLDNFALLEGKLDNLAVLEGKLDNITLLEKKLDNLAVLEGKLDNIAVLEGKLDNITLLEKNLGNIAVLEEKLDNITALLTPASVENKGLELTARTSLTGECKRGMEYGTGCARAPRILVTVLDNKPAFCDTKTEGGGWIIFQRRTNGKENFYRPWADYVSGFGDVEGGGDYWLGLQSIQELTSQGDFELLVEMKKDGKSYYAQYNSFHLGNLFSMYQMSIGGYTGNSTDSLYHHRNRKFSTYDRDNDDDSSNCAVTHRGGWWFGRCDNANLNGDWEETGEKGVEWQGVGYKMSMTEMKIRLVDLQ